MAVLKTDYQDDVLDTSQNANRVFDIKDANGNVIQSKVSFEDVSEYVQEGDSYGAREINEQNQAINEAQDMLSDIFKLIYPVGSIYISTDSENPSNKFTGTTWVRWGGGRVPVGVNENDTAFNTVEKTGGEKTHLLTGAESGQKNLGRLVSEGASNGHTHAIPQLSGSTNTTGFHDHSFSQGKTYFAYGRGWADGYDYTAASAATVQATTIPNVDGNGNHAHTVTTNASNTGDISANHTHGITIGASNATSAHNILQPYITCYMWKRTA